MWCYHKNGFLAIAGNFDDDSNLVYFDDQDNVINEDVFEKKYGQEFEEIMGAGSAELESRIEENTSHDNSTAYSGDSSHMYRNEDSLSESHNNSSTYYGDSSVFSRVKAIVIDKLGVEPYEVVENASFMNDLGADSLDAVELIMEFEKEFGINIPDEIAERIRTVGDAVRLLEKNI